MSVPGWLLHEIGRGDGCVLVGKVIERGETVPVVDNAVAAFEEGRWSVAVNILDMRMPGGHPFEDFRLSNVIVLEAGTERVERFRAQREAGLEEMEELRMQDLRLEGAALRLEDELCREREVLVARREAEAKAAQELAEKEAARKVAEVRAMMIAELDVSLKASGETIFSLLAPGTEHMVQVTREGRRVEGTAGVTDGGTSYASGTLSMALGRGEHVDVPVMVTGAGEPGKLVARCRIVLGFQQDNFHEERLTRGVFSKEHRIMSFEGDPEDFRQGNCRTDRLVIDQGAEAPSE